MVYSPQPMVWLTILCCAATAKPLEMTPSGMNRVLSPSSSSSVRLQDVVPSSPRTLSLTATSSISTSVSTPSQSLLCLPTTSSSHTHTYIFSPLPPPHHTTTTTIKSDGDSAPSTSSSNSIASQTGGGDVGNVTSDLASSTVATGNGDPSGAISTTASLDSTTNTFRSIATDISTSVEPVRTGSLANAGPQPTNSYSTTSSSTFTGTISTIIPIEEPTSPLSYWLTPHDSTSTMAHSFPHHSSSTSFHSPTSGPYSSITKNTHWPTVKATTSSYSLQNTSSSCIPYTFGQTITVYSVVPNTETTTITLYANQSNTYTKIPEWTPPVTCYPTPPVFYTPPTYAPVTHSTNSAVAAGEPSLTAVASSLTLLGAPLTSSLLWSPLPVTTVVTTSKNPVTQFTSQTAPQYPGSNPSQKVSVPETVVTDGNTYSFTGLPPPHHSTSVTAVAETSASAFEIGGGGGPSNPIETGGGNGRVPPTGNAFTPTTVAVGGVTVVMGPGSVAIGSVTLTPGALTGGSGGSGNSGVSGSSGGSGEGVGGFDGFSKVITQNGETFTVNPSQVIGPGTIIPRPTSTGGGVFMEGPTPTVVDGVSLEVWAGMAVVGGSTYAIGAGAPQETLVVNKQTISIGPGGVGFADTTITAPAVLPTNVVIFNANIFTVLGSSVAVFDGTSFSITPGAPAETTVVNGDAITIGPSGVIDGTQTLGGPAHPTGTQYGVAGGLTISEIGPTLAVIDGTTLTVGPNANPTTTIIAGDTITAGPSGLTIGASNHASTTIGFPFNPTTQAVTAGGVTFSEIGSSLVVIAGTTFTIGPHATVETTDVVDGKTISLGPGGIGFATTTLTPFGPPSPSVTEGKKNGAAVRRGASGGVLSCVGLCIALGVGILF